MILCALAALGAYSRGAALAIGAMAAILWFKSSNKSALGAMLVVAAPLMLAFMPPEWSLRMESINNYQDDASAQGRINAWWMTWNLARDRFFGGGFNIYEPAVFAMYAPNPIDLHAAHSIYFQVLGEHGFIGLALYVLVGVLAWRDAAWIIEHACAFDDLRWAAPLAAMIQTSLAGFAVGGAFLSLAYFDVPYYLVGILVATRALVAQRLAQPALARAPA
jgi:probable O-glycosylation ligase (exosortase A-associated)